MRIQSIACRLMCAACLVMVVACVDESFDINEVSKEVTICTDKTTLPLGYLEGKTLEELLDGRDIEGLNIDENGNLSFSYVGETETIGIDGISREFEIPEIESKFRVEDYPQFNLNMGRIDLAANETITVSGFEVYENMPGYSFDIPDGVNMPISGSYNTVFEDDNFHIEFDVPEQILNVNKIYFRDIDNGHHGAPMHIHVNFNGLADVNGGGNLNFELNIEGGSFRILDADNSLICEGNEYSDAYTIASGAESIDFVIYIESITNNTELDDNHHLDLPLKLSYDMNFELTTKAGTVDLSKLPRVSLSAQFEYGDAEVAVSKDVDIVDCKVENGSAIEIAGLPSELKRINRVGMLPNKNSILNLYAHGMDWLGDLAKDIEVVVALPQYLKLHHVAQENYSYDEDAGVLTTTLAQLDEGVVFAIEALDFGVEGIEPDVDGKLRLDFTPSIKAHFTDGSHVNVSSLLHDSGFEINVGIEAVTLSIESFSGMIDYSYEVEKAFELTGLGDIDLNIGGVGIKPIIEVNITHPLTMATKLSGSVEPCVDGEVVQENVVSFSDVELAPATYVDGEIENAEITLIIADESLRESYDDSKYIFIACDVAKLISGALPDTLNIKLSLGVDSEQMQTLYIAEALSISYGYRVDVPFVIDESFEVRYSEEVNDLNSLFAELANYDIEVGDIAIIATVTNTTPLQLEAGVVLKDAEGNVSDVQVLIAEGSKVLGSSDGVTPQESVLRFELDFGEDGKIAKLSEVDAIAIDLVASCAVEEGGSVALNTKQSISAKLQLELDGGITIDLDKLKGML